MLCRVVEFGWSRCCEVCYRKTWFVCSQTPTRRRRLFFIASLYLSSYFSHLLTTWYAVNPLPGNNIYGDNVRETLIRLQQQGTEELAAYILMQRIFPTASLAFLVREGVWHQDNAISELGIYGAYLRYLMLKQPPCSLVDCSWMPSNMESFPNDRNKDKVIMNDQCGYLMRTKVSSSNEGGVAAGFAVLDSIYLTWRHMFIKVITNLVSVVWFAW